ncbi:MAG: cupin domain-containing protein [Legionellales bacterium]|jgi:mannose-6-phosphate isomerase-like protein (cupin superfamily)
MSRIQKNIMLFISSILALVPALSLANQTKITEPMVAANIFDQANKNDNWKFALATGEQAQVVFMSVTPSTNPANEIGMETHTFDQVIFITEGNGNAILNGKTTAIKQGDMIFIPMGTSHNVVNLNKDKPLKIISVYSNTDIPAGSVYPKKQINLAD